MVEFIIFLSEYGTFDVFPISCSVFRCFSFCNDLEKNKKVGEKHLKSEETIGKYARMDIWGI